MRYFDIKCYFLGRFHLCYHISDVAGEGRCRTSVMKTNIYILIRLKCSNISRNYYKYLNCKL